MTERKSLSSPVIPINGDRSETCVRGRERFRSPVSPASGDRSETCVSLSQSTCSPVIPSSGERSVNSVFERRNSVIDAFRRLVSSPVGRLRRFRIALSMILADFSRSMGRASRSRDSSTFWASSASAVRASTQRRASADPSLPSRSPMYGGWARSWPRRSSGAAAGLLPLPRDASPKWAKPLSGRFPEGAGGFDCLPLLCAPCRTIFLRAIG